MLKSVIDGIARGIGYLAESRSDVVLNLHPRVQLDGYSCGLQCLASVLEYYDHDTDELEIDLGLTEEGADEDQLRTVIRSRGLRYRTHHKMSLERLQKCIDKDHPVILPVDDDRHWVVFYGYGRRGVYLMDPSIARAFSFAGQYTYQRFLRRWNGYGIEVYE